jgi:AraC-like DNA-binding protein
MSVSLACSTSDHANCARPSCTCWCEHPERAARLAREAELLARPDPLRTRAAVAVVERPAPAPKTARARPTPKTARPRRIAAPRAPKPPPAPRTKPLPLDEIIAAYQQGVGAKRLAKQHGVSSGTILGRLRAAGVPIRRQGDRTTYLPDTEIAARYQAGESCAAIAVDYDVAETTIANHLRNRGITLRVDRRIDLPADTLALRYRLGWSIEDLAEASGCSPQTVRRRLVDAGVEIRRPGTRGARPDRKPRKATVVTNDAGQRLCPVCRTTVLVKKNPHGPGRYPSTCEACR